MTYLKHTTQSFPTLPTGFTPPLLQWYRENARDLPWRRTNQPYEIWVSEIMLQQTRVAAVVGYYSRFLAAFPSVEALAYAPEDVLLKQWEGLGYYSRARNLQKAANMIVNEFHGRFPDHYIDLLKLPGVGDYTASAIASAAFGLPEPAVDGNVLRVFTRLTDCNENISDPKIKSAVRQRMNKMIPTSQDDIRIFNQAVMELGAVVCAPNGPPKCELCPVSHLCLGRSRGTAATLPIKAAKKARRLEEKTVFLLFQNGKIALRKRPDTGLLAGLWEFPNVEGFLDEHAVANTLSQWGCSIKDWDRRTTAKHIFTHVEWHMTSYALTIDGLGPDDFFWADLQALETCAVPSAFAKFLTDAKAVLKALAD